MDAAEIVTLAVVCSIGVPLFSWLGFIIADLFLPDMRWEAPIYYMGWLTIAITMAWFVVMAVYQFARAVM